MSGISTRRGGMASAESWLQFIDISAAPPTTGDPCFYRVGTSLIFRNAAGTTFIMGAAVTAAEVLAALATAVADIDVNGQKIVDLGTPSASTDAATKGYVDGRFQDGATTLVAGTKTINTGITITANSRIFLQPTLTGQTGTKYVVTSKTVGAPGTGAFVIQAQDATGSLVNTDVSTIDYLIRG